MHNGIVDERSVHKVLFMFVCVLKINQVSILLLIQVCSMFVHKIEKTGYISAALHPKAT